MPLGLVQQGPRLYLVCRYRGYDNERNLAQHRILSAEMSTLKFDRPKEFDLKKYYDDGRFGFGKGEKIRLTFRIERAAGLLLLEAPLSTDQQAVELDDGRLEITATLVDSSHAGVMVVRVCGCGHRYAEIPGNQGSGRVMHTKDIYVSR